MYNVGKSIFENEKVETPSFTPTEGVAFMHSLVLSKEQTRRTRTFLASKRVDFPTTNEMLPVRKSLRPESFSVLDGKRRATCYKSLVRNTISSISSVLKKGR